MFRNIRFAAIVLGAVILSATLASAQYGPKDGANLPPSDLDRIQAGQAAPDFTLPTSANEEFTLSGLRGKNVVLVFYRGYW